jgi:molybdopterin synthase sulfur carrier subunit
MSENIEITVKLFAIYQETYQKDELKMSLPSRSSVQDVLEQIIQAHPSLERWRSLTRFGVNLQFVSSETILENGDEVVLIPPVNGG